MALDNKILIVGGSGFIGRYCVEHFKKSGFDVYATYYRNPPPEEQNWYALNVFNKAEIASLLSVLRPSYLINCAWVVDHENFWSAEENKLYIEPTLSLYKEFVANGGRKAIFLGTGAEFSQGLRGRNSTSIYAQSKRAASENLCHYQENVDTSATYLWLRLYGVFGPGEPKGKIVPYILNSYLRDNPPIIKSPNTQYSFIYARDIPAIIEQSIKNDATGSYDCPSLPPVSLKDFSNWIHSTFFEGKFPPQFYNETEDTYTFAPDPNETLSFNDALQLTTYKEAVSHYIQVLKEESYALQKL